MLDTIAKVLGVDRLLVIQPFREDSRVAARNRLEIATPSELLNFPPAVGRSGIHSCREDDAFACGEAVQTANV